LTLSELSRSKTKIQPFLSKKLESDPTQPTLGKRQNELFINQ
jgi:hypothetical protein